MGTGAQGRPAPSEAARALCAQTAPARRHVSTSVEDARGGAVSTEMPEDDKERIDQMDAARTFRVVYLAPSAVVGCFGRE